MNPTKNGGITLEEFSNAPVVSPKAPCQEKLCYRVDDKTNTGIFTIRTFAYYGDRGAEFAEFTNTVFSDLSDNQRRNLVLDVRDNDGGSGLVAAYILRRLADQPFTIFFR